MSASLRPTMAIRVAPVIFQALTLYFSETSAIFLSNSGVTNPQGICGAHGIAIFLILWDCPFFSKLQHDKFSKSDYIG
jgi:hypothetical protein